DGSGGLIVERGATPMRVCPSCGFGNDDTATNCAVCHRELQPATQPPIPQQPSTAAPVSLPPTPSTGVFAPSDGVMPPPPPTTAGMLPPQYPPPAPAAPILQMPRPELSSAERSRGYFLGIGLGLLPGFVAFLLVTQFN